MKLFDKYFLVAHSKLFFFYYTTWCVLFHSASTRENRESKVFGKITKPKDENIESTEVHSAGGKNQVEQNVEKKGKDLIY